MKGIVLAGGSGTRLKPITDVCCKQLLPVYDKPMIYYPLPILMMAGIKEIALITTPQDGHIFNKLLGDGTRYGCKFQYLIQNNPNGIAEAFLIAENFIGKDSCGLILGDNIFYGSGLSQLLKSCKIENKGATIFAYYVTDPKAYGVVEFDKNFDVISIEEKPKSPKSSYAVPGIYFYDNNVVKYTKNLKPSSRGELEITDLNRTYLNKDNLKVKVLPRGIAWLDTGTYDTLLQASQFVQLLEARQGLKVGCLEEIAWREGFIDNNDLITLTQKAKNNDYNQYLKKLITRNI